MSPTSTILWCLLMTQVCFILTKIMTNLFSKFNSELQKIRKCFIPNHFLNMKKTKYLFPWTCRAESTTLQLKQIIIQQDHTIFFILFSCFSCGKFENTLVTCNVKNPGLFIFPFLSTEQKCFKKYSIIQFTCTIHKHMICISMIMISSIMQNFLYDNKV